MTKIKEELNRREDNRFMRKIIWYLGGITLTSAIAISAMQVQINNMSKAVEQIKETNKTLNKINLTLQKLFNSGENRNLIMIAQSKKQDMLEIRQIKILTEQERRHTTVYDAAKHMKDWRIHK